MSEVEPLVRVLAMGLLSIQGNFNDVFLTDPMPLLGGRRVGGFQWHERGHRGTNIGPDENMVSRFESWTSGMEPLAGESDVVCFPVAILGDGSAEERDVFADVVFGSLDSLRARNVLRGHLSP